MNESTPVNTAAILKDCFKNTTYEQLLRFNVSKPEATESESHTGPTNAQTTDGIDEQLVRTIIEGAERMIKKYGADITYTQLRNILQIVKNERFKSHPTELLLAIPKLAYIEGRPQKGKNGAVIIRFIRELAWKVDGKKTYEAFEEIMNTIVAYHKIHG